MGLKFVCLMVRNIKDSHGSISNIFSPYLRDLLLKIIQIYKKNALTGSIFELKICFFKWVRISPEIDWYHYQAASPALTFIVRH